MRASQNLRASLQGAGSTEGGHWSMNIESFNFEKLHPNCSYLDLVTGDVGVKWLAAMWGYKPDEVRIFEAIAELAAHVRTLAALEEMCIKLHGHPLRKQFESILHNMGADGRARLADEGVNQRDLIKSWILLLMPTVPQEIDDVVGACLEYSEAVADLDTSTAILAKLRRTAQGRAFLRAVRVDGTPSREAGRLERKTHVAVANQVKRIRARLYHER
jgi:hypothetical protein